jgi:hypothetical protein
MNSVRKHLSYANIVATLALVFAMSGGALAASHYLINSTKQINPKVRKALKGNTGRTGTTGPRGAAGAQGASGSQGVEGAKGPAGLSALSSLPSGQSESGNYGVRTNNPATAGFIADTVTFPIPLAESEAKGQVIFTAASLPVAHCSGPGHADRGFVCVYDTADAGVKTPPRTSGSEASEEPEGTGRHGLTLQWEVTAADAFEFGTYTVTAP